MKREPVLKSPYEFSNLPLSDRPSPSFRTIQARSGRVRLSPNRGFPRRARLRGLPAVNRFESTTLRVAISLRQKWQVRRILFGRREMIKYPSEDVGVTLLGEAKR